LVMSRLGYRRNSPPPPRLLVHCTAAICFLNRRRESK
jgi:hypothetical protein